MNYSKILRFLEKGNKFLFDIPVDVQKAYLQKLGEAKDNIDRSKKQYLCQMYFVPKWKVCLFDIVAIFALPCYLFLYWLISLFNDKGLIKKVDCIGQNLNMPEILPDVFISKYKIDYSTWQGGKLLTIKDIFFIIQCFIKTWSPYMVFKCTIKISDYSYMIRRYEPDAIQVCNEYSFTSSIMTEYCHLYGVKHIDVMHGEKLFYIRDSYFNFDETYVWHEHYKRLFMDMYAEPSQFVIAVPPSISIDTEANYYSGAYADYKYYLANFDEDMIKSIVNSMAFVKGTGKSIKYRIHPIYSDVNLLLKYVDSSDVEYPDEVSIQKSIASMSYAVGSYSTVLLQAYMSGKRVILDDLTYKNQYTKLKNMNYILSSVDTMTLSSIAK